MIISSERCYLREWTVDDAGFLYELNSDPEVLEYTGDEAFSSLESAQGFIKSYTHYKDHGFGRWLVCLKETDTPIGFCGLRKHNDYVDLGFRFMKKHWGKGYATEVSEACLQYGFHDLNLDSIIARVAIDNHASIRVIEKLGMSFWKEDLCHGHQANYYRRFKNQSL